MAANKPIGIISYGAVVPRFRVAAAAIAAAHGRSGQEKGLGVIEKAVVGPDQDAATLAVDASRQALKRANDLRDIGAVYVGSESHPYAVKPTSGIVGEALGLDHNYMAADFEFACKAGTAAIQTALGLVGTRMIAHGLAIGSDVAQSKAGDPLEYAAAAGAASFVVGAHTSDTPLLAELVATVSRTYDVPDFWRRAGQATPSHGGRFTGEPAYFRLISETVGDILAQADLTVTDIDHVVFHMPNAKFCQAIAKRLNVSNEQLRTGLTVTRVGNAYSACSLIGFAKVLDEAQPNQRILVCSFGSGAGSDAFIWQTTDHLLAYRKKASFTRNVAESIENKELIDYVRYATYQGKIA